ncbi:MAG: gamma-glutamyl-gamma-aminobutyrate hydrolase family protein [Gemmatimonadota bacterium]|jgi:putative glutamine amidotransferase|nr:gamma-glutamyl-gamma-aminobutyrate hydrolase family protein [Gemmatimonadota bacterium]MDP6529197.1 gamma-glutamyl-gamma-aminobutyrate hydrolase family protein [Gemmatimonadota bacterium]MDP6801677.1 gamma-glutamyl-gamma-aminobutyrate hydrolase family protein [Gemmatimonadota bacterium]MDP7030776.1 gamma-glutamyl-gamma-aminobutyrate hydrolase family protein [Gemmatimonadota bacterium]
MSRRPRIGITPDIRIDERNGRPLAFLHREYGERISDAGGLPLMIPPLADTALVPDLVAALDGVLIVGGEDIDPRRYGGEPDAAHIPLAPGREDFDFALADALLAGDLPCLGICYGCQLLTVASGGSLIQDIPTQIPDALEHGGAWPDLPEHEVTLVPGTRLFGLLGDEEATTTVNSSHHQSPDRLGGGMVVAAIAPDGVIEAVELPGKRFLAGVQWHPELMPDRRLPSRLFEGFVEAADA